MDNCGCLLKGAVHDLASREKFGAIRELLTKANQQSEIREIKNLEMAVLNREKEQSTGVGQGVAIAHGKTEFAKKPLVLLGISRHGIHYDSPDGKPVHLLFIIANHPNYQQEYITVLSAIARLVNNSCFRQTLLALKQPAEVEARLASILNRLPEPQLA